MKRPNQKDKKKRRRILKIWSLAQAQSALPYVASVMRSIRDHRLEAQAQHLAAERLARQPGRPNRAAIIAQEEATQGAERADERFQNAVRELQAIDVYCLDPIQGLALIPFVHENQLAWFVFDLFEENPLRAWRYHGDPFETRRPLAGLEAGTGGDSAVV
jgi:hypothetical protein